MLNYDNLLILISLIHFRTVDYVAHSSKHGTIDEPLVNLTINQTPCTVTLAKLDVILNELKAANKCIKNVKL